MLKPPAASSEKLDVALTVFESHDDVVCGPRPGALGVVRLYVDTIQRVLLESVELASQRRRRVVVDCCCWRCCCCWHSDVEIRRARVVALVADVVADQPPVVMQQRRTLQQQQKWTWVINWSQLNPRPYVSSIRLIPLWWSDTVMTNDL